MSGQTNSRLAYGFWYHEGAIRGSLVVLQPLRQRAWVPEAATLPASARYWRQWLGIAEKHAPECLEPPDT
eukprot:15476879-Alexandrium_andersonii.AAC.1